MLYLSGPWENILTLWQYFKIWLFQLANKKPNLTLPDPTAIPFPNPAGVTFPCLYQTYYLKPLSKFKNIKCQMIYSKSYQNLEK